MKIDEKAPIAAAKRKQLRADARSIAATANRKGISLDAYEQRREATAARDNFELGCWMYYFSRRVGREGTEGLADRIQCAHRLFVTGIANPEYDFFTVFDFGECQFDTIFEMGDADQVVDALRKLIPEDRTSNLVQAFNHHGWPA